MREASVPLPGPSLSTSPLPSGRDASSSVFLGRPNQVKGRGQNVGSEPWAQSLVPLLEAGDMGVSNVGHLSQGTTVGGIKGEGADHAV